MHYAPEIKALILNELLFDSGENNRLGVKLYTLIQLGATKYAEIVKSAQ